MARPSPNQRVEDGKKASRHLERALPRLLTLERVHELTCRSRSSLYTDIALGRLRVTRLGRLVRVFEEDYLDYVERGRQPMSFLRRS